MYSGILEEQPKFLTNPMYWFGKPDDHVVNTGLEDESDAEYQVKKNVQTGAKKATAKTFRYLAILEH